MKKILLLSLLLHFSGDALSQDIVTVVENFGTSLQQWCKTNDVQYRAKASKISKGKMKCLVDDQITQEAVEKDTTQLLTSGTLEMDTYLNLLQKAIDKGPQSFTISNIKARPNYVEPTAFKKNDELPKFVSADLELKGALNFNVTDLYYLREGKITKIIDYTSENSLGKAIELYSQKKYDEAFRIFRHLAYAEYSNFDAQYYLMIMEYKKQGCAFLDKKIRDKELLWFLYKNYLATHKPTMDFAIRVPMDESKLDYAHYPNSFEWVLRCQQPMQAGLMMSFDPKTLSAGFVNERGELVVPYNKYKAAYPFHNGRALVVSKVTGKCGFIDNLGNEAVPMIYQNAISSFYKGKTWCVKDGDAYLVDEQGKVITVVYDHPNLSTLAPSGKYAMLYKDNKTFDIYDYYGNLCYSDYTSWTFSGTTGIVTMKKEGAPDIQYKIKW